MLARPRAASYGRLFTLARSCPFNSMVPVLAIADLVADRLSLIPIVTPLERLRHPSQLSARTFCIFPRELSSPRRIYRTQRSSEFLLWPAQPQARTTIPFFAQVVHEEARPLDCRAGDEAGRNRDPRRTSRRQNFVQRPGLVPDSSSGRLNGENSREEVQNVRKSSSAWPRGEQQPVLATHQRLMKRQKRRGAQGDGELSNAASIEKERLESAEQPVAPRQVGRPTTRAPPDDQLLLEQESLRDHRTYTTGATEPRATPARCSSVSRRFLMCASA